MITKAIFLLDLILFQAKLLLSSTLWLHNAGKNLKDSTNPLCFRFLFSLFWGEAQGSDLFGSRSHSYFGTESIIDSPNLEVNPHCSGLCLGELNVWPNMRRGHIWPYGLKTYLFVSEKCPRLTLVLFPLCLFIYFHVNQTLSRKLLNFPVFI